MKTSSWSAYKGIGRIGISRGSPRGMVGGYRLFKALAPGPWFNDDISEQEYEHRYNAEILSVLDPSATWEAIHKLANGADPVLLCFEAPRDIMAHRRYCHRRMAAKWFETNLGVIVPELGYEEQQISLI